MGDDAVWVVAFASLFVAVHLAPDLRRVQVLAEPRPRSRRPAGCPRARSPTTRSGPMAN